MMIYLSQLKGKTSVKLIEEKNEKILILNEGEELRIKTLYKNKISLKVSCHDQALYVEDIIDKRIEQIKEEQIALASLKKQNKKTE